MDTFPQRFVSAFARMNPTVIRWLVFVFIVLTPIICDPGLPGDIGLHVIIPVV
jgi:hypothetical protein